MEEDDGGDPLLIAVVQLIQHPQAVSALVHNMQTQFQPQSVAGQQKCDHLHLFILRAEHVLTDEVRAVVVTAKYIQREERAASVPRQRPARIGQLGKTQAAGIIHDRMERTITDIHRLSVLKNFYHISHTPLRSGILP